MKKVIVLLIPLLMIFGIKVFAVEDNSQKVILIDPGHGGVDGGAKSQSGTIEKDINLEIALKLKQKCIDAGYVVHMTRDSDTSLSGKKKEDLDLRCKMKRETNCDLFISIHQNKFPQANCFGAQVWYADNIKSGKLAKLIQNGLKETVNDNNKRVPKCAKKEYRILRDNYEGASVIVECGFISNPSEEQKLKTSEHQDKIAEGILKGVKKYFQDEK
ncbi:MAG: N-acetylmuramoyl-L-alanine amidase CwlD [Clostridium sp.]